MPDSAVVTAIALADERGQNAILLDLMRDLQPKCKRTHPADVCMKQVFEIGAGSPNLRIEVQTARREPTLVEDHQHHAHDFTDVRWELVGIPAQELIPAVGVDA